MVKQFIFSAAMMLAMSVSHASTIYPDEKSCATVPGQSDCFTVVASSDIDNIGLFPDGSEFRVDFKIKSRAGKNLYFKGGVETAKANLATLLAAKTTGNSVKIYVKPGANEFAPGNGSTQYMFVMLVDP